MSAEGKQANGEEVGAHHDGAYTMDPTIIDRGDDDDFYSVQVGILPNQYLHRLACPLLLKLRSRGETQAQAEMDTPLVGFA